MFEQRTNDEPRKQSKKARKTPQLTTMERWMDEGGAQATDGCWVEPDGICPHGCPSWLLEMGLI